MDIRKHLSRDALPTGYRFFETMSIVLVWMAVTVLGGGSVRAEVPIGPILLGQSCAMSGPSKNIGLEFRAGLLAAFLKYNDEGGYRGREVRLLSRDDGYEPDRAMKNTREFIVDDQVFLLIGEVGTPTSKAVVSIAEEYRIPFFAPFTGADLLRNPARKQVINVRASYSQEMEKLASYLIDTRKLDRIACFYQNDSFGFSGLEGIGKAMQKRGMKLVSQGSYERNTVAVMGAVQDIFAAKPEAVVMAGTYSACAEFIKLSKNIYGDKTVFCNISFVGTESLRDTLGNYGENVIVSQVVPFPRDFSIPLVREYVAAMKKYQHHAPLGFATLEGYIAGKLFIAVLSMVDGELTREKFIETMHLAGRFDLGGVVIEYGEDDNQGMDDVFLTTIYPKIQKLQEDLPVTDLSQ